MYILNLQGKGKIIYIIHIAGRVGKKMGNIHISQDGGKYLYLLRNTGK